MISALLAAALVLFAAGGVKVYAGNAEGRCLGVDVSNHNDRIDWAAAKKGGVEFAIIRIGWGDDLANQDDPLADYNMKECERLGIPYGVYIYSYAITTAEVDSEVQHTIRMLQGHDPALGVWFDMEDADSYKNRHNFNPYTHGKELTDFCIRYLDGMRAGGYTQVGVYANPDYFRNVLDYDAIKAKGMIWCAHWYTDAPAYECDMWQYAANGKIAGCSTQCDMNWILSDSPLFPIVAGEETPEEIPADESRPEDATEEIPGDVDGNGEIDVIDLALIQKSILKKVVLSDSAAVCADVNGDGEIDVMDLALVQRHILKKTDLIAEYRAGQATQAQASGAVSVAAYGEAVTVEAQNAAAVSDTEAEIVSEEEITEE